MNIAEYAELMKNIQTNLLIFIEKDDNDDHNFQNLQTLFNENKIQDNKYNLISLFHLIAKISNNHHRGNLFFDKIFQILLFFKDCIQKHFSNSEIFNIFINNKRIILFFIEEGIIIVDDYIAKKMTTGKYIERKYPEYFSPELKPFLRKKWFQRKHKFDNLTETVGKELPANFYDERKKGENNDFLSVIIQKDSINEFIAYVNQSDCSLCDEIESSIYETNCLLLKKQTNQISNARVSLRSRPKNDKYLSFIEYAAFYGSIKIFQYLSNNGVEVKQSLMKFAIHSNNTEIVNLIKDKFNKSIQKSAKSYFKESMKCHHHDIANYFADNFLDDYSEMSDEILIWSLKYYNFEFMKHSDINESLFCYLCKYDYFYLVSEILKGPNVDINKTIISIKMFINEIFISN